MTASSPIRTPRPVLVFFFHPEDRAAHHPIPRKPCPLAFTFTSFLLCSRSYEHLYSRPLCFMLSAVFFVADRTSLRSAERRLAAPLPPLPPELSRSDLGCPGSMAAARVFVPQRDTPGCFFFFPPLLAGCLGDFFRVGTFPTVASSLAPPSLSCGKKEPLPIKQARTCGRFRVSQG